MWTEKIRLKVNIQQTRRKISIYDRENSDDKLANTK